MQRDKMLHASIVVALVGAVGATPSSKPKPNIVLIVADDQGYANIGYHNETMLMPRISEMARAGVILENYYVQPVCSPTRSALMTGRYTNRLGTQATVIRSDVPFGIPLGNTFMSHNLQDAGYHTALYGKWHLGFYKRAYTPLERGFDEHLGYFEGAIDYVTHVGGGYSGSRAGVDWHRANQTTCFEDSGTWTEDLIVAQALAFLHRMAKDASKPFFLFYPLHLIHGPSQAPRRFLDKFPERNLSAPASSYGMCGVCECRSQRSGGKIGKNPYTTSDVEWGDCRLVLAMSAALDWAVGELVDGLMDAKLYNNTILIYTSDNGAQPGQGGTNYPLRGWKTQLYEGGIRVPGFVHSALLPSAVRGTVHRGLFHVSDWLPTVVIGIAGGSTERNLPLDGVNIWPAIIGGPDVKSPRSEVLHTLNAACGMGFVHPNAALRVGDMKLLVDCFNYTIMQATGLVELYNVTGDPFEYTNLAPDRPATVAQLISKLRKYAASPDQVPPVLFPENAPAVSAPGIASGFYQCPQCSQGNAFCDSASSAPENCRIDPWCDHVTCVEEQQATPQQTLLEPTARPSDHPSPVFYWNVNSPNNTQIEANLTASGIRSIRFHQVALLGQEFGLFPCLACSGPDKAGALHGGIPQRADLSAHLKQLAADLVSKAPEGWKEPLSTRFDGYVVLDYESWRANWGWTNTPYRNASLVYTSTKNPSLNASALECAAEAHYNQSAMSFLIATMRVVRQHFPQARGVGMYDYPLALAYPFGFGINGSCATAGCPRSDCPYPQCGAGQRQQDNAMLPLYREMTALYPSLYLTHPSDWNETNAAHNREMIEGVVAESFRIASLVGLPSSSVVPYTWYRYHDGGPASLTLLNDTDAMLEFSLASRSRFGFGGSHGARVGNYLIYGAESNLPRRANGSIPIRPGESGPSVEETMAFFNTHKSLFQ